MEVVSVPVNPFLTEEYRAKVEEDFKDLAEGIWIKGFIPFDKPGEDGILITEEALEYLKNIDRSVKGFSVIFQYGKGYVSEDVQTHSSREDASTSE